MIKYRARKLGRNLHRETDIPFPMCMKIGRMLAQGKPIQDVRDKFPMYVKSVQSDCGCCGMKWFFGIANPQGEFRLQVQFHGSYF